MGIARRLVRISGRICEREEPVQTDLIWEKPVRILKKGKGIETT
jgi:hypothetical protein